jgi:hypothetical protein
MQSIPDPHRKKLEEALVKLQSIFPDNAILCVVTFPTTDGINVCSASNVGHESQMEIMTVLLDGYSRPKNATLN